MRAAWVLLFGLVLVAGAESGAASSEVVISTGKRGGSYYGIGLRLQTELRLDHEREAVVVATSEGSLENLARLDDPQSKVNVALTQADALKRYLGDHPEFAEEYLVLADLGRECAFIVAAREGPIGSAADLKKNGGHQISVEAPTSGAAVTWENMTRLEPSFGNTSPVFVDFMEAMLQIKAGGEFSPLKAAMFVQRPRQRSPAAKLAYERLGDYRFVPIRDTDVKGDLLLDGSAVYTFERVTLGGKSRKEPIEVETLCTRGLMLAAKSKLSADLRGLLAKVMLEESGDIVGADE